MKESISFPLLSFYINNDRGLHISIHWMKDVYTFPTVSTLCITAACCSYPAHLLMLTISPDDG